MSSKIREYVESHLIGPMQRDNTVMQDTMVEIIIEKLELLYDYTIKFPEIISPSQERVDILKVIADQFVFDIRDEAKLKEQVAILDNILYVYNRRGSIDTIENMWKYYGGDLPKEVKVVIPSYKFFRYSISPLSGNHVFPDNDKNRTGIYEIQLINNTYPIPELREFMIKELVAAGNGIYFTNVIRSTMLSDSIDSNPYKYIVDSERFINIDIPISSSREGLTWSGYHALSSKEEYGGMSGKSSLLIDLVNILPLIHTTIEFLPNDHFYRILEMPVEGHINLYQDIERHSENLLYCTSSLYDDTISCNLYSIDGGEITSPYPGNFILANTLLGVQLT